MPGLVDTHNHLALTYKEEPESNVYYSHVRLDPTPLRAIQAVSNGIQMLNAGFTIVRDMGNAGNYADAALRVAIEQGWIPGPTIINSGIIIGGMGGQFWPTPEMAKEHNIVYPEYLDADTPDEIVKAVRQNALFGARVIKICVDCKPWGYTVDEIKLFIAEAAKIGFVVEGHVQTVDGARRAIEAGIWSIAHDIGLNDEMHKGMAAKGIYRAGTETPITLTGHTTPQRWERTVAGLRNAWENKVPITFSTDADYYVPGKNRGEVAIEFIETWKAAKIPNADILRAMTVTGYRASQTEQTRGPIAVGMAADLIAVRENPLENIDALRDVRFVLKDGKIFKRDGVMTPAEFFHGGPVHGWRRPAQGPDGAVPGRRRPRPRPRGRAARQPLVGGAGRAVVAYALPEGPEAALRPPTGPDILTGGSDGRVLSRRDSASCRRGSTPPGWPTGWCR
jgi:imidazolonepropionase-like amidohydrolase